MKIDLGVNGGGRSWLKIIEGQLAKRSIGSDNHGLYYGTPGMCTQAKAGDQHRRFIFWNDDGHELIMPDHGTAAGVSCCKIRFLSTLLRPAHLVVLDFVNTES